MTFHFQINNRYRALKGTIIYIFSLLRRFKKRKEKKTDIKPQTGANAATFSLLKFICHYMYVTVRVYFRYYFFFYSIYLNLLSQHIYWPPPSAMRLYKRTNTVSNLLLLNIILFIRNEFFVT